jgi:general secretion pathway protein B
MSFILDALKKAESERSRQSGPVLMDARTARARQRLPVWAWVLGGVLLANLLVLAWILLRKPPIAPPVAATPAPVTPTPVAPVAPVAPATAAPAAIVAPLVPSPGTLDQQNTDNLPTMQDLLASGTALPALQLNLHVYDEAPANRYVLLNSKRVREGDEVTEGLRVEAVTPRGVVMSYRGRRFLMPAGG